MNIETFGNKKRWQSRCDIYRTYALFL